MVSISRKEMGCDEAYPMQGRNRGPISTSTVHPWSPTLNSRGNLRWGLEERLRMHKGARFDGKRLTWSLEDLILVLGPLVSLRTQKSHCGLPIC